MSGSDPAQDLDPAPTGAQAVGRALAVLQAFTRKTPTLSLGELAARLRLSKGTTHRLLRALQAAEFVEQDPASGRYRLGFKVLELAGALLASLDLPNRARPAMEQLSAETGESSYLAVVRHGRALCLVAVEGTLPIRDVSWGIGQRLPLHCGAAPRMLLAHLPEEEREAVIGRGLRPLTARTVTDPHELRVQLGEIRRQGYAVSFEDTAIGSAAVAAPIRDASGRVIASLSLAGVAARFGPDALSGRLGRVQEAARRISRSVGYRDDGAALLAESGLQPAVTSGGLPTWLGPADVD